MRLLVRLKRFTYRMLGVVSPSGAYPPPPSWVSDLASGPLGQKPREYRCALACCPHPAGLAQEDPEAFNVRQEGVQGS